VTEVDAGLQQLANADLCHRKTPFVDFVATPAGTWTRMPSRWGADSGQGHGHLEPGWVCHERRPPAAESTV
jgi:hypothetical protein